MIIPDDTNDGQLPVAFQETDGFTDCSFRLPSCFLQETFVHDRSFCRISGMSRRKISTCSDRDPESWEKKMIDFIIINFNLLALCSYSRNAVSCVPGRNIRNEALFSQFVLHQFSQRITLFIKGQPNPH